MNDCSPSSWLRFVLISVVVAVAASITTFLILRAAGVKLTEAVRIGTIAASTGSVTAMQLVRRRRLRREP